jgi:phosphate transport system substrate-binding protein
LTLTPVGKEAFVFIVNASNPIKSMSLQNLRDIYSGRITSWKELGGADDKILAFQRNEGSGSQSAMLRVMNGTPMKKPLRDEYVRTMIGLVEGIATYRNAPNAIGYSFRYYVENMTQANVAMLAIDGVSPTVENIASGAYPLSNDFYIVTARPLSPNSARLIEWFKGKEGQRLVKEMGYVPMD